MDPAILRSPVYVSASFTILKLCSRVPSPLASFHHKPTNLLRYGRLFMLTMPGQGKAFTKDKFQPPESTKINRQMSKAAVQPPLSPPAQAAERRELLSLGANLVTSTLASFTAARPAQFEAPRAKFKASQLPVPLVSQCCHPNSPWQPPPLHLLERTPYSFGVCIDPSQKSQASGAFFTFCSSVAHL